MSLEQMFSRILDLENPWDEAQKKLQTTYMFVNEELMYVHQIPPNDKDLIVVHDFKRGGTKDIKVKSLEVWLPETGVYFTDDGMPVLITKFPKRQWARSFSTNYYNYVPINRPNTDNPSVLAQCARSEKKDIFVDWDRTIYYWSTPIGYIKNENEIVCTNGNFEQELKDWNRKCR